MAAVVVTATTIAFTNVIALSAAIAVAVAIATAAVIATAVAIVLTAAINAAVTTISAAVIAAPAAASVAGVVVNVIVLAKAITAAIALAFSVNAAIALTDIFANATALPQQEAEAPVDGRCQHDERQRDNQPDKRHERGHWQQKQQQLQLRNNQLKRNEAKMCSSSQWEVAAQRLTWRRWLCNGRGWGGSNDDNDM